MMEGNSNIFLAGGDALVYLTGSIYKMYSTIFVQGYPFSTYVCQDQFFTPPPLPPSLVSIFTHLQQLLLQQGCSKKFNRTYVLNNMTQMLQVNQNSNVKYNDVKMKHSTQVKNKCIKMVTCSKQQPLNQNYTAR